ncbi:MAG: hypothetical protein DLM53_03990 [Candidatus Eremiobacter antarcticus]|nr:hypothetical protein [Candidatus Eremiobacteraeota bacterium]PZR63176.1 MAG: hypothetical protein DLM53_03990 [Candidatus Eremiobacter sp. RRmetagenome_bin22]
MAKNQKPEAETASEPASLERFIREEVIPVSHAFAGTPLMRLRVKTPHGRITLDKLPSPGPAPSIGAPGEAPEDRKAPPPKSAAAARVYDGEIGRTYDTINAEVVGTFRDGAEPLETGARITAGQTLGHIEALRLKNPVLSPLDCMLVAQVVVDGQAVDFGETLFVVESAATVPPAAVPADVEEAGVIEPPRL